MKMKWILPGFPALMAIPSIKPAAAPVFAVVPGGSSVTFHVKASMPIQGRFDRWKSTLSFASPDVSTGVFLVTVDAGSVNMRGLKDGALKSDKFFDVKNNPVISFHSTRISQTGPNRFAVTGVFTVRGVSKPETLVLTNDRAGPDRPERSGDNGL